MTPPAFAEMFSAHWPSVCAYVARRTRSAGVFAPLRAEPACANRRWP